MREFALRRSFYRQIAQAAQGVLTVTESRSEGSGHPGDTTPAACKRALARLRRDFVVVCVVVSCGLGWVPPGGVP
jgi:hypothetical protein